MTTKNSLLSRSCCRNYCAWAHALRTMWFGSAQSHPGLYADLGARSPIRYG